MDADARDLGDQCPARLPGGLICRWEGQDLVDVSGAYVDRLLHRAELRAGVRAWPAHAWRRSTATLLRERGADWEDVSAALTHRSPRPPDSTWTRSGTSTAPGIGPAADRLVRRKGKDLRCERKGQFLRGV